MHNQSMHDQHMIPAPKTGIAKKVPKGLPTRLRSPDSFQPAGLCIRPMQSERAISTLLMICLAVAPVSQASIVCRKYTRSYSRRRSTKGVLLHTVVQLCLPCELGWIEVGKMQYIPYSAISHSHDGPSHVRPLLVNKVGTSRGMAPFDTCLFRQSRECRVYFSIG